MPSQNYSDAAMRERAALFLHDTAENLLYYMRAQYPGASNSRLINALRDAQRISQAQHDELARRCVLAAEMADPPTVVGDAEEMLSTCAECGDSYPADGDTWRETESIGYICAHCVYDYYLYSASQECYIPASRAIQLHDTGGYISNTWARVHAYRANDGEYFEDRDNCEAHDNELNASRATYGYHETTPQDVHGGWPRVTPRNSLCFGVELEMEHANSNKSDGQQELSRALGGRDGFTDKEAIAGRYILMNDGSLNGSGVELITQPYLLEFHQSKFGWKNLLDRVSRIGQSGSGTESCGMHVHVNRQALSALTLGKMLVFVNAPANTRLIETIAQRDPEEWASRHKKSVKAGKESESDKYEAMHLSTRTVEFRIFRGNLRPDRVLKNIEFCHAVFSYARDTSMQDLESPTLFITWLAKRKSTYPNLAKFLSEKAFMSRLSKAANAGANARPSTVIAVQEEI